MRHKLLERFYYTVPACIHAVSSFYGLCVDLFTRICFREVFRFAYYFRNIYVDFSEKLIYFTDYCTVIFRINDSRIVSLCFIVVVFIFERLDDSNSVTVILFFDVINFDAIPGGVANVLGIGKEDNDTIFDARFFEHALTY